MALDFPSGIVDEYEWTDPSNGVTYVYDISKNSWTAKGGPGSGGSGLQPEDIDTDKGLEIGADGKLGVKVNEAAGIYLDTTEGIGAKVNEATGIYMDTVEGTSGKVYEEYGIMIDGSQGPRLGDSWANIPSL